MIRILKSAAFVSSLFVIVNIMYFGEGEGVECPVDLAIIKAEQLAMDRHGGQLLQNPTARWISDCTFKISGILLIDDTEPVRLEHPSVVLRFDRSLRRWKEL